MGLSWNRPLRHDLLVVLLTGLAGFLFAGRVLGAAQGEDRFTEGYIAGVLQARFAITGDKVRVQGDTASVILPRRFAGQAPAIRRVLLALPAIRHLDLTVEPARKPVKKELPAAAATDSSGSFGPTLPATASASPPAGSHAAPPVSLPSQVTLQPTARDMYRLPTGVFPSGSLFAPLLADPRWPGFSAEYEHFSPYHPISSLKDVIQVSIGDTLPFDRGNLPLDWQWEYGMQATVFAFFNTDTRHTDLQNADYFVGGYAAFRHRNFSLLLRYYHQSSHLGDELLINDPQYVQLRQKISYEEINAIASLDLYHRMFRIYAGVGFLEDVAPRDLRHWRIHYGAEYHGPTVWRAGTLQISPVAGVDLKNWNQTHWDTDVSLRLGLQLDRHRFAGPQMQFLLEYYNGQDQNGQFFVSKIQYIGFGIHYYF